jgi:sugar/nucleoside kinase (ribokinase family)
LGFSTRQQATRWCAPANFAYHAHALGAEALVVSRVGNDPMGCELLSRLQGVGLRTDGITTDPSAPTGTVSVTLDGQGKPTFTIHENVAWDLIEAVKQALDEASRADAVCFGTLAQRKCHSPVKILEQAHRIADYVCTQPGAMPPLPPLLFDA